MQEADKAYIAGFLDADGCIIIDRQKRTNRNGKPHGNYPYYYVPRICIANRHIGVLNFINESWGNSGSLTKRNLNAKNPNWSDAWQLRFSSKPSYKYLKEVLPYLRMKQRQAELVIEMGALKAGTIKVGPQYSTKDYESKSERYDEIYHTIKSMNRTGQEYFKRYGVNSGEAQTG